MKIHNILGFTVKLLKALLEVKPSNILHMKFLVDIYCSTEPGEILKIKNV